MKLTAEQLKIAQSCVTADELIEKARAAGVNLSSDDAQAYIDSATMVEIDETNLSEISGGCTHTRMCSQCKRNITHENYFVRNSDKARFCSACAQKNPLTSPDYYVYHFAE